MVRDIWMSFRSLPRWVQIWMALILIPVNLVPLTFLDQPHGELIAMLAVTGMALNIPIMLAARGMSKAMALPHLLCWGPLVIVIVMALNSNAQLAPDYVAFLLLLLVVDSVSLAFDIRDSFMWVKSRSQEKSLPYDGKA